MAIRLSCILTAGVDFVVGILILAVGLVYYKIPLGPWAFLAPVIFGIILFLVAGLGLIFSVVSVYVRDVTNALPILLRAGFVISPVLYSAEKLRDHWNWLYELNPVSVVIDTSRKILLHGVAPDIRNLEVAFAISFAVLALGVLCFKKLERNLADYI